MSRRSTSIVSDDESRAIELMLNHPDSKQSKSGLQRLCEIYETGRHYRNGTAPATLVTGLLLSDVTVVRRWAYKAIAYCGSTDTASSTLRALNSEKDIENQTWAIAALGRLSHDANIAEICRSQRMDITVPVLLAQNLFRTSEVRQTQASKQVRVDIDRADTLTLKWSAILFGYDMAPENILSATHNNALLIQQLNNHHEPEVAEYSIWALYKNPASSSADLLVPLDQIDLRPENVRRWINRLLIKDQNFFEKNLDLFDERSQDRSFAAREGLALGLQNFCPIGASSRIVSWYSRENERSIVEVLLEHMARYGEIFSDYNDVVLEEFKQLAEGARLGYRERRNPSLSYVEATPDWSE